MANKRTNLADKLYLTLASPFGYIFANDNPNGKKISFFEYMKRILVDIWTS